MTRWALADVDGTNMTSHEDTLYPVADGIFPDGGVLVDVGANMGLWSVRLGQRASRVIAVEPNPAVIEVLRENITLNGLDDVVQVLEVAAWDDDEPLDFHNPSSVREPKSGLMRVVPGGGQVRGRRLDDTLPVLDRIDLVKVDTEGADIKALAGMTRHLAAFRPVLLVESHHRVPYEYYTLEDLTGFLASIGYEWENVNWASQYHLICRPTGAASE